MPDNTAPNNLFVRSALRQAMIDRFSLQEIKDICFDLGIDADDLDGTTRGSLVRELLARLERRNSGADLMVWLRASRPEIEWPDPFSIVSPSLRSSTSPSTSPVHADTPSDRTAEREQRSTKLEELRKNLQLIEERRDQYVMETDIPLQLIKEERRIKDEIATLEKALGSLRDDLSADEWDKLLSVAQLERPIVTSPLPRAAKIPAEPTSTTPAAVLKISSPVAMELVPIPAGEFLMGSDPEKDKDAHDDEKPQHTVYLPDFYIARTPVTNAQFEAFVRAKNHRTTAEVEGSGWAWTGSQFDQVKGADWRHPRGPKSDIAQKAEHPVVQVSWHDAVAFCQWLSEATGQPFRVPTEAEWEKAARGTQGRVYPWGDSPPTEKQCNFNMNVKDTTPVGSYPQGATPDFGVLDLAGNVWEWVSDWFDERFYDRAPQRSPTGPDEGRYRVLRGGSWSFAEGSVRAAVRFRRNPDYRYDNYGFRCARSV